MCECLDYSDGSRYQCLVCVDLTKDQLERLARAESLVSQQAEDESLWLVPRPPKESSVAHLQESLRSLHMAVEGNIAVWMTEDPY